MNIVTIYDFILLEVFMKKKGVIIAVILLIIILGIILIKTNESKVQYNIGIGQFADHVSLDNCREGFIEGLKQEGIIEGKNLKIENYLQYFFLRRIRNFFSNYLPFRT